MYKRQISEGLVDLLGEEQVTHVATDDYHRYDRTERKEHDITPLHPECNYMDIMTQDLAQLRQGKAILKPVYHHDDGTLGRPEYIVPRPFAVVEGLLGYHNDELRDLYDVRVFLAPPEDLRRKWKIKRDTSKRGYSEDEVEADMQKREPDSAQFIRPQRQHADIEIQFLEGDGGEERLDAEVVLGGTLEHPDLSPFQEFSGEGIEVDEETGGTRVRFPGNIDHDHAMKIQESIWEKLSFASHLRSDRLGLLGSGDDAKRSDTLGLVQLLVVYHLATAKATVALGGTGARNEDQEP